MGRTARTVGLIGLGAALGAFAAVPALHLVGHEDDHVHIDGAIVPLHHDAHHEDAPDRPESEGPHGSGSLAHFGAAFLEPPAIELEPIVEVIELEEDRAHRFTSAPTPARRARAPPVR